MDKFFIDLLLTNYQIQATLLNIAEFEWIDDIWYVLLRHMQYCSQYT